MIQLAGQICLALALIFALLQSLLPLWGQLTRNPYALACARPGAIGQFICVGAAYALLTYAFINNDFSIAYVAANSHSSLPFMYKLTAVWGAHEGSILLWIMILNIWSLALLLQQKNNPLLPLTLAILGIISFSFLSFLIFTSNPFLSSLDASLGHDLNPLLQDPGFVIHPPMLYMGYVGFAAAFAITQAALLQGQLNAMWAHATRCYALAAWAFLTFGIMLGSWWAYRVLGWGGFWFWDPVENASLLPWITGVALIHVLVLAEKRNVAANWACMLATFCFILSLLGTFLVRSGVLISAHTFASDPARGMFLLIILGVALFITLTIYMLRANTSQQTTTVSFLSREFILLFNSAILLVAMLTILLGTLYPLIFDAFHLGAISVGAPYFNTVMMPLVFITLFCMGIAPFYSWRRTALSTLWCSIRNKLFLAVIIGCAALICFIKDFDFIALITLVLCAWVILSAIFARRALPSMSISHFGFALLIIGIVLSSILNQEKEIKLQPGDTTSLGPYNFVFINLYSQDGSNYHGLTAHFNVTKNMHHVTDLYPEKRIYTVRDIVMTKVDIHPGIFRDLYIALGEPLANDYWSVRIYYKPFVRWIWFGGIIMMIGAISAIIQRKLKK